MTEHQWPPKGGVSRATELLDELGTLFDNVVLVVSKNEATSIGTRGDSLAVLGILQVALAEKTSDAMMVLDGTTEI